MLSPSNGLNLQIEPHLNRCHYPLMTYLSFSILAQDIWYLFIIYLVFFGNPLFPRSTMHVLSFENNVHVVVSFATRFKLS